MRFHRAAAGNAVAFLVAVLGTAFAAPAFAKAGRPDGPTLPTRVVTAAQVEATLAAGHSFEGRHLRIEGTLDLRAAGNVAGSFRCTWCTITGSLLASDVEFRDVIDLDHTHVGGTVDMRGALFDRGVLWTASSVAKHAWFIQAVFRQTTAFDGTVFGGPAVFSWARFQRESSFLGTGFQRGAFFDRAVFIGDETFAESLFAPCPGTSAFSGRVSFAGASFHGRADFRERCFTGSADLTGAIFLGQTNFRSAEFLALGADAANFSAAIFGADASFKLVTFRGGADFQTVSAAADLSFEGATFFSDADLTGATIGGVLSFTLALRPSQLSLNNLTVGGVSFDPAKIDEIPGMGAQEKILTETEDTARAVGDTATANNARFARLQLEGDHRLSVATGWWAPSLIWLQDRLFYREIAGYLVRPLRPVRAFLVLAGLGVLVRAARQGRRRSRKAAARRRVLTEDAGAGQPTATADAAGPPAETAHAPVAGARSGTTPEVASANAGAPSPRTPDSGRWSRVRRLLAATILSVLEAASLTAVVALAVRPTDETKSGKKASASDAAAPGEQAPTGQAQPTPDTHAPAGDAKVGTERAGSEAEASSSAQEPRLRDYLVALVRWVEYASYKILIVLFITCVANVNSTLHQFIDTIIGGR